MRYDITFHPISESELQELVFGPLNKHEPVSQEVIQDIAGEDAEELVQVKNIFEQFPDALEYAQKGHGLGQFVYRCAALAGYLHPYWLGIRTAIKYLPDYEKNYGKFVTSLSHADPNLFKGVDEEKFPPQITQNYSGGGFIPAANTSAFLRQMIADIRSENLDIISYAGLIFALNYSIKHNCGIIEASDVVDTTNRVHVSTLRNLKTIVTKADFPHVFLSFQEDIPDIVAEAQKYAKSGPVEYEKFVRNFLPK